MSHLIIRRTWPCGTQDSIDFKGWTWGALPGDDGLPRPCPVHGTACHKGVGRLD